MSILGMDECNIFEQLSRQQYQQMLDCIREVILATDIAAHLRKVDQIAEIAEGVEDGGGGGDGSLGLGSMLFRGVRPVFGPAPVPVHVSVDDHLRPQRPEQRLPTLQSDRRKHL